MVCQNVDARCRLFTAENVGLGMSGVGEWGRHPRLIWSECVDIGIDALPLMGRGGISRHLQDLLPALVSQGEHCRYHLFARMFRPAQWKRYRRVAAQFMGPNLYWHRVFLPDRLLECAWTHHDVALPGTGLYMRDLDVFLATSGLAPAHTPCPIVGVVHDLIPLRFPQWFPADLALIRARLEKLVQRSCRIIAVSESTRHDLQKMLGVPGEKIRVVHHGIHPRFRPPPPERSQTVLAVQGITGPFFLHVGGLGPMKNVRGLLEAFRVFQQHFEASSTLVLLGDLRWAGTLPSEVKRLGLTDRVRFLGFVEDDVLPVLYAGAMALVLPSWYEGFGFPALEAMACGTPVLAAQAGSLPDLLGDAALFFPPEAPVQLAELMIRMAADKELHRELRTRGRARAARFTWERAATETLAVLQDAATVTPSRGK